MSITVTKDTSVWKKLKKNFIKRTPEIQVGWFQEQQYGASNDNLQMAQVAQWQEEGTALIPSRPFMRVGLINHLMSGGNKEQLRDMAYGLLSGKPIPAYTGALKPLEKALRQVMMDWDTPPNGPMTEAMKGFNDPLIDTSQLVANVTARIAYD